MPEVTGYRAYLADVPRWVPRAPRRPRPADRRRLRADRDRNHQGGALEKALPLIMTWRADKRAVNTAGLRITSVFSCVARRFKPPRQLQVYRLLLVAIVSC